MNTSQRFQVYRNEDIGPAAPWWVIDTRLPENCSEHFVFTFKTRRAAQADADRRNQR